MVPMIRRTLQMFGLLLVGLGLALPLTAQDRLYVAIQGEAKVSVIDIATLEEVERIDLQALGFSENAKPHHIAVAPDGSHWYLSLIGENQVLKFDRRNQIVARAEFQVPGLMALGAEGDRLYVGRSMSAVNPPRSIGEITTGTMEVEPADVFFPRPHALAVAPGKGRIFSASLAQNQMGSIDAASFDMQLLNLEGPVHTLVQFAVSPDESTLVATTEMTGKLLIFDLSDAENPSLTRTVDVGTQPWHPVFEPGSSRVWFGLKGQNEVVGVDAGSGEILARISDPGLNHPHGSAISPDGRYLFISSNGPGGMDMGGMPMGGAEPAMDHAAMGHEMPEMATTGTLTVIDLSTHQVVKVLEMGENATGIGTRHP